VSAEAPKYPIEKSRGQSLFLALPGPYRFFSRYEKSTGNFI
jgi:hypothetical protein